MDEVVLRLVDYNSENLEEKVIERVDTTLSHQKKPTVTWFNIDGLHESEIIEQIGESFDFDKLVLAEVMDTNSRPKVHDFGDCILLFKKK